jgi:uncharacterized protein (TIGR03435 family)
MTMACALILAAFFFGPNPPAAISSGFEVASIRPSTPGGRHGVWTDGSPNQIRMLGMNLKQLMTFEYDVESDRISGSGLLTPDLYDVIGKIPEDVAKMPEDTRWPRIHNVPKMQRPRRRLDRLCSLRLKKSSD